jgi:uncharacterized SAM-binding protein YcdF (DUF218 family)
MSRPHSSAVLVLGASLKDDGKPSPAMVRRVAKGCEFFQAQKADFLILSGGYTSKISELCEAEIMGQLAMENGLGQDHILLETKARTTLENILNSERLIRDKSIDRLIIISDPVHLPRVQLICDKRGVSAELIATDTSHLSRITKCKLWFYEAVACIFYRYKLSKQK